MAAVLAILLVTGFHVLLRRGWPDAFQGPPLPLIVPLSAVLLGQLVLGSHPMAGLDQADTLAAGRADPYLLISPQDHQRATGDLTTAVSGQRVPLPHSPALRLSALILAPLLGEQGAVQAIALFAAGALLLLVFPLARSLGVSVPLALAAQGVLGLLPGWLQALASGTFSGLLGAAFFTLLVVHLARRLCHLDGARDAAAASLFVGMAVFADGGSLLPTLVLVLVLASWEQARGHWRHCLRLLGSAAVALALVTLLAYTPFLVGLVQELGPSLHLQAPRPGPALSSLWSVGGPWLLAAAVLMRRPVDMPRPAWQVAWALLGTGVTLLLLRSAVDWPGMAAPGPGAAEALALAPVMAALAAAALSWAANARLSPRLATLAAASIAVVWSLWMLRGTVAA